tara:strand:- start:6 stop:527 length:522 start_codon:yes stop_codon:yes gene_type:complete
MLKKKGDQDRKEDIEEISEIILSTETARLWEEIYFQVDISNLSKYNFDCLDLKSEWERLWNRHELPFTENLFEELEKDKIKLNKLLDLESLLNEVNCSNEYKTKHTRNCIKVFKLDGILKRQLLHRDGLRCDFCGEGIYILDGVNHFSDQLCSIVESIYIKLFQLWADKIIYK